MGNFTVVLPIGPIEREEWLKCMIEALQNEFIKVNQTHPSDIVDWTNAIHDLQKIMAVIQCRKAFPEDWQTIETKVITA